MKVKFIIPCIALAITALMGTACSKMYGPSGEGEGPPQKRQVSTLVTPEMAVANVERFISSFEPAVKSGVNRTIASLHVSGRDMMPTKSGTLSTSDTISVSDPDETPFVYIANFSDDRGFCVVPGDTRLPEVLIYVDEGQLMPGDTIDNPGLAMYLEMADTYYRMTTGMPVLELNTGTWRAYGDEDYPDDLFIAIDEDEGEDEITYEYSDWRQVGLIGVEEKIDLKWHQDSPFNKYCFTDAGEQAVAGCVPVAVALLMSYHGKDINYYGTEYDWDLMRTVVNGNSGTPEAQDMVATLIRQLGWKINLDATYGIKGTGADPKRIDTAFKNFGYAHHGTYTKYDSDKGLALGPIIARGDAFRKIHTWKIFGLTILQWSEYYSGHDWVISHKITLQRDKHKYINDDLAETVSEEREYVHCNWGWGGSYNGYYFDKVFDVSDDSHPEFQNPDELNTKSIEGEDNYFRYVLRMHYGVKP